MELLRSSQSHIKKDKISNTRHFTFLILRFAMIGAVIVLFIIFGIPYLMDITQGVDPALRYAPHVESQFNIPGTPQTAGSGAELKSDEIAGDPDYTTKNDPYMDGDSILFSTDTDKTGLFLNSVVLYNTKDKTSRILPNVEKKYDNILETKLSGNYAVWADSMVEGGGRICGYDLTTGQMFVVKEYAYALPSISVSGDNLAFTQVAGTDSERVYLYNLKTRQNVTVRLYTTADKSAGDADVSGSDLVWSEYSTGDQAQVQRLVLDAAGANYQNPDFGSSAYGPKSNGRAIVFCTSKVPGQGNLMLSVGGEPPVEIAQNPVQYEIGTNYVVYMKDQKIYVYGIDNSTQITQLTSQATRGILASMNGNKVCFYDTTDAAGAIEVVRYIDLGVLNG